MIRNRFSENRIRVATPRVDPGNVMDYTGISKGLSASMRAQCRSACACARTARALADKMRAHNPWGLSKTSRDHPSMRAQRALRAQGSHYGISRRGLPVQVQNWYAYRTSPTAITATPTHSQPKQCHARPLRVPYAAGNMYYSTVSTLHRYDYREVRSRYSASIFT